MEQPVPCGWGTCAARRAWRKIGIASVSGMLAEQEHPLLAAQWADGVLACGTGQCHVHIAALNNECCSSGIAAELLCPVMLLAAWGRSGKLDLEKKTLCGLIGWKSLPCCWRLCSSSKTSLGVNYLSQTAEIRKLKSLWFHRQVYNKHYKCRAEEKVHISAESVIKCWNSIARVYCWPLENQDRMFSPDRFLVVQKEMMEETGLFLADWPRWAVVVVSAGILCKKTRLCQCREFLPTWWFSGETKNGNLKLKFVLKARKAAAVLSHAQTCAPG